MTPRRILLATFGSLGDLHPFLALATALRERGHIITIAAGDVHEARIRREGFAYAALRPHLPDDPELIGRLMNGDAGAEELLRGWLFPRVRESYDDLRAALPGHELMVTHTVTFGAPLVAEVAGVPWATVALAPIAFFSATDPSIPPKFGGRIDPRRLGPWGGRLFGWLARQGTSRWAGPIAQLRRELGLPPGRHPLFEGAHSPQLTLALFSPLLGAPQPDWPASTKQTGFLFHDTAPVGYDLPPELVRFLENGPPPVVFTLGSAAVHAAGDFYRESLEAVFRLGCRAVLLLGRDERNRVARVLPEGVIAVEYAPYGQVFPRAAALVHQGGVGTSAQALRAGKPMLVVPFSHDQPDNGARLARLGVARVVRRPEYRAGCVAGALRILLADAALRARAEECGRMVRAESGAALAVAALEKLLVPRMPVNPVNA